MDARQAAERLKVTVQHVYNLNSSRADFPAPVYIGRTPLWPVDQLDAWREAHPQHGK
ncbi:helix-turn-helix domain-containing protein [Streptomyces sp. AP-93]|nr:helix-turn-helix domain-containing protein [Streptomyces sp. AP-93]